MIQISSNRGVYAVQFTVSEPSSLTVGRLQAAFFPAGEYVYIGSACGPGGLQARLGRHLSGKIVRPHWHIDYLRRIATASAYCYLEIEPDLCQHTPLECLWSQAVLELPYTNAPILGFGSSDCRSRCRAHLAALGERAPSFGSNDFLEALSQAAGKSSHNLIYTSIV